MLLFKANIKFALFPLFFHRIGLGIFVVVKNEDKFKGGGGGGGGFSPDFCENTILRYELTMMARTCTNNLRVVLSP